MSNVVALREGAPLRRPADVVAACARDRRVSSAALRVLVVIASFAKPNGEAWPSLARIAGDAGVTRSTAHGHIRALEQLGVLTVRQRHRVNGSNTSNLYVVNLGFGTTAGELVADEEEGADEPNRVFGAPEQGVRPTRTPMNSPQTQEIKKAAPEPSAHDVRRDPHADGSGELSFGQFVTPELRAFAARERPDLDEPGLQRQYTRWRVYLRMHPDKRQAAERDPQAWFEGWLQNGRDKRKASKGGGATEAPARKPSPPQEPDAPPPARDAVAAVCQEAWPRVRARVRARVGDAVWNSWCAQVVLKNGGDDGKTAVLGAKLKIVTETIEKRYLDEFRRAWGEEFGAGCVLRITTGVE